MARTTMWVSYWSRQVDRNLCMEILAMLYYNMVMALSSDISQREIKPNQVCFSPQDGSLQKQVIYCKSIGTSCGI